MYALELFSGTGSVGKVLAERGYTVISVDLCEKYHTPTHLANILEWDYKQYPVGHFDMIWASPPCETFSVMRCSWIGRKNRHFGDNVITKEMIHEQERTVGLPLLRKAQEIIEYFAPRRWVIENPHTGRMKNYITQPPKTVDYCKYSDWGYKKPTDIWTNNEEFIPKRCKNDCENMSENGNKKSHKSVLNGHCHVIVDNKAIIINTKAMREKYKGVKRVKLQDKTHINDRYRIPARLVLDLI